MRYEHIIRAVLGQPWAILPSKAEAIAALLALKANGGDVAPAEIEAVTGGARAGGGMAGGVAVIPVLGTIHQRASLMTETSGGTSTERLGMQVRAALADPAVAALVLDIDSPGGAVGGIPELAAELLAARRVKPIVAAANGLAASAAYWLATAADEVWVTPSGEVGSIGVLAMHEDVSRAADQVGVTVSFISAGKYKTEGNPYEPLGDEARSAIQARVDDYYGMFVADVAKGRRREGRPVSADDVRGGYGEGRVVGAREAVRLGMADSVGTLGAAIDRAAALARTRRRASATAEASRLRAAVASAHEME